MKDALLELLNSPEGLEIIKKVLENNLNIEANVSGGDYGSSTFLELCVKFSDEIISREIVYLP